MTQLLNGKEIAIKIKQEICEEIEKIKHQKKRLPHLGIILSGNNVESIIYVNKKIQECKNIGLSCSLVELPENSSEQKILEEIYKMNNNPFIDGFIIQLPLPQHINVDNLILSINPDKDVDGFHPENFGKMALNMNTFIPATAYGIITLLQKYKIKISGKHTVVIGRSRIVGLPISILMSIQNDFGNSTVTLTHTYTKNLFFYTKKADIIIVAVGSPGFLTGNMIKKGAILIDVGINKINQGIKTMLKGDIDFDSIFGKASYITPVPGGIGPMTIIMLIKNTIKAAYKRLYKSN
ncbi:bifunctional 5,10-methylenetetrahydrofolate dehydrogenase/5,10-methenyltetrahydrofolate cyclohydrolase [Blattabacterium cuenoti]|uniref:bifunctional 5,10-methylenetetrahydrofolate dehydrogenase/5,10-methenyltetrahydrofolate cyclohydrolase n=1 Tax=Blattabacterium cuenoti TaxID=1653831 RepID=UPI00163B94BA|nr:bifunctional 5,10-methylenetetrahydrofolate dehydrogenase/5,10-methenyltetrahydrofolate cyclohydrolase [Blattabacterium cuenoti]